MLLGSCKKSDQPEPAKPTKRTVLVYMLASNSLGYNGYDEADLQEMRSVAPSIPADCRWLVYYAPKSMSVAPQLIEITPEGDKVLASYASGSGATADHMSRVISDTKLLAPASSYGLVLWSHATGWLMDGAEDPADSRRKSFGNDFGEKMNITTLARVLSGTGFDYVYFDACYMGAVEVAYELRNCVATIVASPSEVPGEGMPYHTNMKLLLDGSPSALRTAAANTFAYYDGQAGVSRTCTMGVYDTSALDALAKATADIYAQAKGNRPALTDLTDYAGLQRTGFTGDLEEYVETLAKDASVDPALVSAFKSALSKAVTYSAATPMLWNQYPIRHCSGLSTFVFEDEEDFSYKGYDETAWARDVVARRIN